MSKIVKAFSFFIVLFFVLTTFALNNKTPHFTITDTTKVWEVMTALGKVNVNSVDVGRQHDLNKGQQLVTRGTTLDFDNKRVASLSARFVCTDCHTTIAEHPAIGTIDAQSRLEHADTANIPFLPGAPFYGLVNRIAFFNDDYQTKFKHKQKHLLELGHRDIRQAIQACNVVYARGRVLEAWEIESILTFLWTLELKMGDLQMPKDMVTSIQTSIETKLDRARSVNFMRRYYSEVYDATLIAPLSIKDRNTVGHQKNSFKNGARVYKKSCLHCHFENKIASFKLDENIKTFTFLKKHFDKPTPFSIYDGIRYNPNSKGNKKHPPHFTAQRMSDKQIQDLRFFITEMDRLGNQAYEYHEKSN